MKSFLGMKTYHLKKLAEQLDLPFEGDPAFVINGIASLKNVSIDRISFYNNVKHQNALNSAHGVVILQEKHKKLCHTNMIFSANPYKTFVKVMGMFVEKKKYQGVHPTAMIASDCTIAADVSIGPYTVIDTGTVIGAGTVIGSHCHIGEKVSMADNCILYNNINIADKVSIGKNAIIHSGVVIGADGFGFIQDGGESVKVPQLGGVALGNDIEIGSNTCVDRGTLDNTIIGHGVKIDNLVQIAHNVVIGDHTIIAGKVAIGGSTTVGSQCMIGGASVIADNIQLGDRIVVTGGSAVAYSILESGVYSSGIHVLPHKQCLRINLLLQKSDLWIKSFMKKLRR